MKILEQCKMSEVRRLSIVREVFSTFLMLLEVAHACVSNKRGKTGMCINHCRVGGELVRLDCMYMDIVIRHTVSS